jgi:hypothetical protein
MNEIIVGIDMAVVNNTATSIKASGEIGATSPVTPYLVDCPHHWSRVMRAAATLLLLVVGLSGASNARAADLTPNEPATHRLCTRTITHGGFVVIPCKPTVIDRITATTGDRPLSR